MPAESFLRKYWFSILFNVKSLSPYRWLFVFLISKSNQACRIFLFDISIVVCRQIPARRFTRRTLSSIDCLRCKYEVHGLPLRTYKSSAPHPRVVGDTRNVMYIERDLTSNRWFSCFRTKKQWKSLIIQVYSYFDNNFTAGWLNLNLQIELSGSRPRLTCAVWLKLYGWMLKFRDELESSWLTLSGLYGTWSEKSLN